ncbi:MAG: NUDIX hydrolase [Planctomycetes bacterium]|nr:NUDIX hydrolase [Planctomycetota bacterium]
MSHTYKFPRAAVAVDCVVFGLDDEGLKVLLIKRGIEPFKGKWALPGGFVRVDETCDAAAKRELAEETGLKRVFFEQLYTFSDVKRDPRERVISVAYYALVNLNDHKVQAATDAEKADWFDVNKFPKLAFDHSKIFETAKERLHGKVRYVPIGFELLPQKFALTQLQKMYEKILERPLDKRNFRKKVLAMGILEDTGESQKDVAHRAAKLYRFNEPEYKRLMKLGFNFEL